MSTSQPAEIADALKLLWLKFLPQIEERVAVMEAANLALSAGTLTNEDRDAAHAAAHKLAGVLGTFGLTEGTSLAREAETLYQENPNATDTARLAKITAQLNAMVSDKS